jgi:octaprenyl-diphosphate synthase
MYQMDLRGKLDVTEEAYLRMVKLKTAALFAAACRAGAMVGGLCAEDQEALAAYGDCLGIAFQMIDDILDFIGEVDLIGKPVGNDLRDGRVTLPLIVALRNADIREAAGIREIAASDTFDDEVWEEVVEFVDRNDGIGYTRRSAESLVARAKTRIEHLAPGAAKDSLVSLADLVITRYK